VSLTTEKVWELWNKVRGLDAIFSDDTRYDPVEFSKNLLKDAIILEVEGGGFMSLSDLHPGTYAEAHLTFWDRHLSPRRDLIRECLLWAFMFFDLQRIEVVIPSFARAIRRFLKEKLGFIEEGILRKRSKYKGEAIDQIVLALLREEVLNG
jgi:hypothetical protein